MRKIITVALGAFVIGGVATGAVLSQAQPAPAQQIESMQGGAPGATPSGMPHPGMPHPSMHGPGMTGWMHGHKAFNPRAFALVYRQQDRQLGTGDVQKIAEAFLLWNGNHSWKVADVAATSGGPIGFSVTTPEGSVVAKFTMDPHTGQIARVG